MAKFRVNVYYQYVGSVDIEAESFEDAFNKGFDLCEAMETSDLDFIGAIDAEVKQENGGMEVFNLL